MRTSHRPRATSPWQHRIASTTVLLALLAVVAASAADGQAPQTSDAVDVAVFPEGQLSSEGGSSRVQLAGSGPHAWAVWSDEHSVWAQRADHAAVAPSDLSNDASFALQAYSTAAGGAIAVLQEYDDDSTWLRTVRLDAGGAHTVDRVTLPEQVISTVASAASAAGAIVSYTVQPADGLDSPVVAVSADRTGQLSTVMRMSTTDDQNIPQNPAVAIDAHGRAVVCWEEPGAQIAGDSQRYQFPTVCRIRPPASSAFEPQMTVWNASDIALPRPDPIYVSVAAESVAIGPDGTIGVLDGGDGAVAAFYRDGHWTAPIVLSTDPTEIENSSMVSTIDAAGVMHAAWVSTPRDSTVGTLRTASVTPDGDVAVADIDQVLNHRPSEAQLTTAPDGGTMLLWVADRQGSPLRLATAPPGRGLFAAPIARDGRTDRRSSDFDISPNGDPAWVAVVQHTFDVAGTDTGTAAISLMPALPTDAPSTATTNTPADHPAARLRVRIGAPQISRRGLSFRLSCTASRGRCHGHATLLGNKNRALSRAFAITGRASTLRTVIRFSGPRARRLLAATQLTVTVSARTADGRIASDQRSIHRAARK